jgi:Flp pilus assembly protein TadG
VAVMRRWLRIVRFGRRDEGGASVEFAIILPMLMMIILGGLDLGHMYYIKHLITNASREGARYAARYTGSTADPSSTDISNYVKTTLGYSSQGLSSLTVAGTYAGASPNKIVTVTVNANKDWWILGILPGVTDPMPLTGTTAMTVERP